MGWLLTVAVTGRTSMTPVRWALGQLTANSSRLVLPDNNQYHNSRAYASVEDMTTAKHRPAKR
jgi:hypothetical protein